MMQPTIGFIGTGSLGKPIAANLLSAGQALLVFNRTASKALPLAGAGAVICQSVEELARQCRVVFSMVSDDRALSSICLGPGGLLEHLLPGSLHISMSTILPQTAREMSALHKEKGQYYLAAPVFGRPEAAAARKLQVVVSGDQQARTMAEPLLRLAGASGIWDFGEETASANTVKLCGNFLIAALMEAMGESMALASKSGVDASAMWSMFNQTLFNTPLYHNYSRIILGAQFDPAAFTMTLGLKDIRLVLEQAASVDQSMPTAELLRGHMQHLVDSGKGNIDWSGVSLAVTQPPPPGSNINH